MRPSFSLVPLVFHISLKFAFLVFLSILFLSFVFFPHLSAENLN